MAELSRTEVREFRKWAISEAVLSNDVACAVKFITLSVDRVQFEDKTHTYKNSMTIDYICELFACTILWDENDGVHTNMPSLMSNYVAKPEGKSSLYVLKPADSYVKGISTEVVAAVLEWLSVARYKRIINVREIPHIYFLFMQLDQL